MQPVDVDSILREMVRRIVERFEPSSIVLFGSFARGTATADSDVDLLIVMPVRGSRRALATQIDVLVSGLGVSKDILVVTPEEVERYRDSVGTIIRTALNEGRTVYARAA